MQTGQTDIHGRQRRRDRIEEILNDSDILPENKKLILEYVRYRTIESSISILRQEKLISNLLTYAGFLGKSFKDATKDDITRISEAVYNLDPSYIKTQEKLKTLGLIKKVEYRPNTRIEKEGIEYLHVGSARTLSPSTKNAYCKILKKFYRWLKGCDNPPETSWLKPPSVKISRLNRADRLYWEDVETLSRGADNKRDFALPQVFFDSGLRAEELGTLRRKDAEYREIGKNGEGKTIYSVKLHVQQSKTLTRSPEIYKSVPALTDWLDNMKNKDPEAFIFCDLAANKKPMIYKQIRSVLVKLKKRSGLKKRVNPHHFRKSACSYCIDLGMTDSAIDTRFGWIIGSKVKRHYGFPDEAKANEKYLALEGAIQETRKDKKEEPKPRPCFYCETINPIGRDFCINPKCRLPLNPDKKQIEERARMKEIALETMKELLGGNIAIPEAMAGKP